MNIVFNSIERTIVMLGILLLTLLPLQMHAEENTDADIENRVISLNTSVDVRYTKEVSKRIRQFTVTQRQASNVMLGRVNIYFPLFERVLRERGLPEDLKYLAVIESGLNPQATSRSGAAGLWQFMKPTARMQGLKVNKYLDERRDPEQSTHAAADYLEYLYDSFNDWTLALAAYNCGPGNVRKAIRRSGGKTSYWDIQRYLPRETRHYIPKFIAMTYMMNYYYMHDLYPELPSNDLIHTQTAKVYDAITLKKLSKELNIDYNTLRLLNAKYIRGYIPKNTSGRYTITLPYEAMYTMMEKYEISIQESIYDTKPEEPTEIVVEKPKVVQKRATVHVPHIPKVWYNMEENEAINSISDKHALQDIKVFSYHKIGRKESLADIASLYNVSIEDLMQDNNYSTNNLPRIGDHVKVVQK